MKLLQAISSGAIRAFRSNNPLVIIWLINILSVALIIVPFRKMISNYLGNSYATELIKDGFSLDFWADMGPFFQTLTSATFTVFLLLLLLHFFIGIFLNGGLFDALRANSCNYKLTDFFMASARLFFSYLVVTFLVLLMIIFAAGLIIALPLVIHNAGDSSSDASMLRLSMLLRIIFLLVLPIFLLVIDYARAWMAANDPGKMFKALGYGFKATFKSFFASYLFMALIVVVQFVVVFVYTKVIGNTQPQTSGGLFLLFLIIQIRKQM